MKKTKSGSKEGKVGDSPSQLIDARIKALNDWRGETLARIRALIKKADPEVVEEWKWVKPTNPGTPVWSHAGIICTGETYKNVVKMPDYSDRSQVHVLRREAVPRPFSIEGCWISSM